MATVRIELDKRVTTGLVADQSLTRGTRYRIQSEDLAEWYYSEAATAGAIDGWHRQGSGPLDVEIPASGDAYIWAHSDGSLAVTELA